MGKPKKSSGFVDPEELTAWKRHWGGMPEFVQEDLQPFKSLRVHFASQEDMEEFARLIGQKILVTTRSVWFPKAKIGRYANKRFVDEQ